jgi:hypothetical protein
MGDAVRKIVVEESRLRRVLGRLLAPGLVKATLDELRVVEPTEKKRATDEEIERARADARREAKR